MPGEDVQKQYEAYPYPHRDPKSNAPIATLVNDLPLIGHYGFGGKNWFSGECRILIAGGGTGDATLHLAEQFSTANPKAEIIHLDISQASNDITQARLNHKSLENVRIVKGSLLDLPNGKLGAFDYINCSGVLHHLENPNDGAKALCSALKENGAMSIMLYGAYGRRIIYDVQNLAKMISAPGESLADRIPLVRDMLKCMPAQNPLRNQFPIIIPDNELVDRYLHVQDRAYTVAQIFDLLGSAGLKLSSFIPSANYDPVTPLPEGDLQKRISVLPEEQKFAFAEIMCGSLDRHIFFATKKGNKTSLPDPSDFSFIPGLVAAGVRLKSMDHANGIVFAKPFQERLEPIHFTIISKMDGNKSLSEIMEACQQESGMNEKDFKKLWLEIFRVLGSRGNIALRSS